jgi:hypothetical protein
MIEAASVRWGDGGGIWSTTVVVVSGAEPNGHWCQSEMHASCPHKVGGGVRLFGGKNGAFALLCNCVCHSACPLATRSQVTDEDWIQECTCSGGDSLREIQNRVREEADLRISHQKEVFLDIDLGHGKSPEQIQREILAAYDAKGYEAPSDFSRISRFVAANTARRGTRTVRLLAEIVGSLRAARRWAEKNVPENAHPDNQGELGRMRRTAGSLTALATTAAVSAYFTRGFIRLGLVLISVLLGALAAWVGLWASTIGLFNPSRRSGVDPT